MEIIKNRLGPNIKEKILNNRWLMLNFKNLKYKIENLKKYNRKFLIFYFNVFYFLQSTLNSTKLGVILYE